MSKLDNIITKLDGAVISGGVEINSIQDAENILQLSFSKEYTEYLLKYGQIEAKGIELSGISSKILTSVVDLTLKERVDESFPMNHYVIEDIGIDGIVYTQDNSGRIYQHMPHVRPVKVADSLTEYINNSLK